MTFSYMHVIYWMGVIGHILPLSEDNIYRVLNKCITILRIPYIRGRSPQWRRLAKPPLPTANQLPPRKDSLPPLLQHLDSRQPCSSVQEWILRSYHQLLGHSWRAWKCIQGPENAGIRSEFKVQVGPK